MNIYIVTTKRDNSCNIGVKKLKHHILPQQRTTAETLVEAAETP
jgi:hypothetical protein